MNLKNSMWISFPFFISSVSVNEGVVVLKSESFSIGEIFVLERNNGFVRSHVLAIFLNHPVVQSVGLLHDDWRRVGGPVSKFGGVAANSNRLVSVDDWMEYGESDFETFPFVFHVDPVGVLVSAHDVKIGNSVVGLVISGFGSLVDHDVLVFEELGISNHWSI